MSFLKNIRKHVVLLLLLFLFLWGIFSQEIYSQEVELSHSYLSSAEVEELKELTLLQITQCVEMKMHCETAMRELQNILQIAMSSMLQAQKLEKIARKQNKLYAKCERDLKKNLTRNNDAFEQINFEVKKLYRQRDIFMYTTIGVAGVAFVSLIANSMFIWGVMK